MKLIPLSQHQNMQDRAQARNVVAKTKGLAEFSKKADVSSDEFMGRRWDDNPAPGEVSIHELHVKKLGLQETPEGDELMELVGFGSLTAELSYDSNGVKSFEASIEDFISYSVRRLENGSTHYSYSTGGDDFEVIEDTRGALFMVLPESG